MSVTYQYTPRTDRVPAVRHCPCGRAIPTGYVSHIGRCVPRTAPSAH